MRWRFWQSGGMAGALFVAALALPAPSGAGTTERIVADRLSGLALWGYDPVAYQLDGTARPGRPEHELALGGVTWRFVNAGNLEAFREQAGPYLPAFGGHDPGAAARGAAVPGHPEVFAVWNRRLYLFRDEASRERFLVDPPSQLHGAEFGWGEAEKTLAR